MTECKNTNAAIPTSLAAGDSGSTARAGEGLIVRIWRSLNPWWPLPESYWPY